jgi:glutamate synthase (NADPH) large chain
LLTVADVDSNHWSVRPAKHDLSRTLDAWLIQQAAAALEDARPVEICAPIRNVNRTAGTMLGSEVTRRFGPDGLPADTITVRLEGTAGQSFGAFLPSGVSLFLSGDANDYVAKGLSGGRVVVRPHPQSGQQVVSVIAGNTVGYGATSGELYLRGTVGERFAVRNSGAIMVAQGAGDHACEYMTGGRVVILGPTGRNVGAGMSGGIAYLLDADPAKVNPELVDLESLAEDEVVWLGEIINNHKTLTGSLVAKELLDDWPASAQRFVRIMPRDYRKVLELRAEAATRGLDADELIMQASHG